MHMCKWERPNALQPKTLERSNTMKNPRTKTDLRNDPRVQALDHDSDGWDCFLKVGFAFDGERRISLGSIRSLCLDMRTVEVVPVAADGKSNDYPFNR